MTFPIKFVDNPTTLNEMKKDNIKSRLRDYFAEFWFVARVFWLLPKPRPGSDRTTPICPNSAALVKALMRESDAACHEIPKALVGEFVQKRLCVYSTDLLLPSTCNTIEDAFRQHLETTVEHDVLRQALRQTLFYKPGHTIQKHGSRKRCNVNVYLHEGKVMTIKPASPFGIPTGSGAASSSSGV